MFHVKHWVLFYSIRNIKQSQQTDSNTKKFLHINQ